MGNPSPKSSGFQREIDLRDGVLLHDAGPHDQAHKHVDVEVDLEQRHPQVAERTLEGLGRALEYRANGDWHLTICKLPDAIGHISQRGARLATDDPTAGVIPSLHGNRYPLLCVVAGPNREHDWLRP